MELNRRTLLASVALGIPGMGHSGPRPMRSPATPTDPIGREVLGRRVRTLTQGGQGIADTSAFRRNWLQIIDQNFAECDAPQASFRLDALTDAELSDLAQLYVSAATDRGMPERLMYLLSHRLDERRLARLARHFGFERVHAAVFAVAPQKLEGFVRQADVHEYGPTPGEHRFGPQGRFARPTAGAMVRTAFQAPGAWRHRRVMNFTKFLDHSPYEIYLSFRTAPVGALGVAGALMEAASVLSTGLGSAYTSGWSIGTYVVKPLIETYAPDMYINLGDWIGNVVDRMYNAWSGDAAAVSSAQWAALPYFNVPSEVLGGFVGYGGDYGAVSGLIGGTSTGSTPGSSTGSGSSGGSGGTTGGGSGGGSGGSSGSGSGGKGAPNPCLTGDCFITKGL